jgi:hypothetical protein
MSDCQKIVKPPKELFGQRLLGRRNLLLLSRKQFTIIYITWLKSKGCTNRTDINGVIATIMFRIGNDK